MTSRRYHTLWKIVAAALVLGSCLINLKNIFTSCQVDAEYQVTMAYRLLRGDRMFEQMWEAHQTSAFFLAFFEWFFLKITGSVTGIMVYANAVGILCKTAVAFCVYRVLQKYTDKKAAFAALLFVLNTYPKDIVLPDFANLQIWFGLLLMCCLILYTGRRSVRWLILGAVCLCIQVLAYPSCVLLWPLCMVFLWRHSLRRGRDMGIFTGVCGLGAAAYLVYFMRGNPGRFVEHLYLIWSGDESHAVGFGERLALLGQDLLLLVADMKYILVVAMCAVLAAWIWGRIRSTGRGAGESELLPGVFSWFLGLYILGYLLHLPEEEAGSKYHFFLLYLFVEGVAWARAKRLDPAGRNVFEAGQLVGPRCFCRIWGFSPRCPISFRGYASA